MKQAERLHQVHQELVAALTKIASLPMPSGQSDGDLIAKEAIKTAQEAVNALLWDRLPFVLSPQLNRALGRQDRRSRLI